MDRQDIKGLHISGLDESRPPRIRKEPYIDLHFKLSDKAPKQWCDDFNEQVKQGGFPASIQAEDGLYIDTWVRKPEEVPAALQRLKRAVSQASSQYLKRIQEANEAALLKGATPQDAGEQGRLNRILAELDFGELADQEPS